MRLKRRSCNKPAQNPNCSTSPTPSKFFVDISPTTIQKRRTLKPLLSALTQKEIKYWWLFSFGLKCHYKNKTYTFSNFLDGEKTLLRLGIISQALTSPLSGSPAGTAKRQLPTSLIVPLWHKQKYKRSKDSNPA